MSTTNYNAEDLLRVSKTNSSEATRVVNNSLDLLRESARKGFNEHVFTPACSEDVQTEWKKRGLRVRNENDQTVVSWGSETCTGDLADELLSLTSYNDSETKREVNDIVSTILTPAAELGKQSVEGTWPWPEEVYTELENRGFKVETKNKKADGEDTDYEDVTTTHVSWGLNCTCGMCGTEEGDNALRSMMSALMLASVLPSRSQSLLDLLSQYPM